MGKSYRTGASSLEMAIFALVVVVIAILIKVYLFPNKETPAPVPRAPVVEEDQPRPEPTKPKPAPPPVIVETPKAAPAPAPVVVAPRPVALPPPPPPPLCQVLESQLNDARDALAQAQADVAAAKQASIAKAHQSPEYLAAKADADAKKQAKDEATATLHSAPNDSPTDEMKTAVAEASQGWLDALAKMADIENTAVADDPAVAQTQQALKDATAKANGVAMQLTDCVQSEITKASVPTRCPIADVSYDPSNSTVLVSLCPSQQLGRAAMADVAMTEIGNVLEKALHKSAYSWTSAIFRVYFEVNGNKAVEFQATYHRDAVDQANFASIDRAGYMDNQALVNLVADFWVSPLVNRAAPPPGQRYVTQADPGGVYPNPGYVVPGVGGVAGYDVLVIGGYTAIGGPYRPPVYVRCPHDPKRSSTPPPVPKGPGRGGHDRQKDSSTAPPSAPKRPPSAPKQTGT